MQGVCVCGGGGGGILKMMECGQTAGHLVEQLKDELPVAECSPTAWPGEWSWRSQAHPAGCPAHSGSCCTSHSSVCNPEKQHPIPNQLGFTLTQVSGKRGKKMCGETHIHTHRNKNYCVEKHTHTHIFIQTQNTAWRNIYLHTHTCIMWRNTHIYIYIHTHTHTTNKKMKKKRKKKKKKG